MNSQEFQAAITLQLTEQAKKWFLADVTAAQERDLLANYEARLRASFRPPSSIHVHFNRFHMVPVIHSNHEHMVRNILVAFFLATEKHLRLDENSRVCLRIHACEARFKIFLTQLARALIDYSYHEEQKDVVVRNPRPPRVATLIVNGHALSI